MEKHVSLTQTLVISTQWTLKRPKKLSKAKFEGQRPKISNYFFKFAISDQCDEVSLFGSQVSTKKDFNFH